MRQAAIRVWIAAVGAVLVCSGCGFKGPLYLPERTGTVVTHPGKNKNKSSQPSQPSSSAPTTSPATPPPQGAPSSSQ